jgi:hypothetical protein
VQVVEQGVDREIADQNVRHFAVGPAAGELHGEGAERRAAASANAELTWNEWHMTFMGRRGMRLL